ncbi:MAG: hypothetical protein O7C72_01210 [Deltaproteobacteria bacterium]|nr:hypothetical protein [Deltaproteobacteria bacterium]
MDSEEAGTLTRKQVAAIPFLAAAPSILEGARNARVSTSMVYRWLRDEVFSKALEAYRRKLAKEGFDYLKSLIVKAAKVYEELLSCGDVSVRRLAAKDVMTFSQKVIDQEEIMVRLEALEDTTHHSGRS